jgi:hypothetical protein
MSHYLLSTFSFETEEDQAAPSPEDMQAFMQRVMALEEEMDDAGAFVFGGALHGSDTSTTLRSQSGRIVMTDGPFIEAKEQIAGFYIIEAADLDEALEWATKTVEAIQRPIEVRPFRATGRAQM